jgi:hypothetical protein
MDRSAPLIWALQAFGPPSLGHFWMVQKSGAEAEKRGPRSEWYCKTMAELRSITAKKFEPYFCNEAGHSALSFAKSVACGWGASLSHVNKSSKLDANPCPAIAYCNTNDCISPPMDPPTVLERFSDAAKVVLLDYAVQPKLWGAMVQICTAVETPGRKGLSRRHHSYAFM